MTSPRPAARRSRRSVRTLVAVVLIVSALAAGAAAIVVASVAALAVALSYAVVVCSVAARLLSNETAEVRRDWARDRATLAHDQSRAAVQRKREHVQFADTMAERVRERDARIDGLVESLQKAEQLLEAAEADHAAAVARSGALESELDVTRESLATSRAEVRRLREELETSRAAEDAARAELSAWQETGARKPA